MSSNIHQTAIVHSGAELGAEVEVGPYSIIGEHVRVGNKTRIGSHVVIEGRTTLGEENTVYPFASLGGAPQDLKFGGEPSTLVIGARNAIREYVTLHPGTEHGRMTTTIGDDNLFMVSSHVAHDCIIGNQNVFANSVALAGHVQIANHVILGGLVGVHQFCRVGDYVMLGGGAMVDKDVPPFCIGNGDRCKLRGLNLIGLQRAGVSEDDIAEVKKAYRHLFGVLGKLEEKIASFPKELSQRPLPCKMLAFAKESSRGISRPAKSSSSA